MESLMTTEVSI